MNYNKEDIDKLCRLAHVGHDIRGSIAMLERYHDEVNPYIDMIRDLSIKSCNFEEERRKNIHGIENKIDELREVLINTNLDIIKISESMKNTLITRRNIDTLKEIPSSSEGIEVPKVSSVEDETIYNRITEYSVIEPYSGTEIIYTPFKVSINDFPKYKEDMYTIYGLDTDSKTLYIFGSDDDATLFLMYWILGIDNGNQYIHSDLIDEIRNSLISSGVHSSNLFIRNKLKVDRFKWYRSKDIILVDRSREDLGSLFSICIEIR